jgi:hypothetical protein
MTTSHDVSEETVLTAVARLTPAGDNRRLNLLSDPAAAEVVGRWMADEARAYRPDLVVVWDEPQAAVLAHIVAREVGCAVVRAVVTEGLVVLIDAPRTARRAILVAGEFTAENSLSALLGVVESHGLEAVAAAVAVGGESPDNAAAGGRHAIITPSPGLAA